MYILLLTLFLRHPEELLAYSTHLDIKTSVIYQVKQEVYINFIRGINITGMKKQNKVIKL